MGFRISTNTPSITTNRVLSKSVAESGKSYQRLASGERITESGDDAAGLSISENLRSKIRSMHQAERNANDGISFIQTAEGGLTEINNIIIRLRELSIQAASDTLSNQERGFLNTEVSHLVQEIDRIANTTSFNGVTLLNGKGLSRLSLQIGALNSPDDAISLDTMNVQTKQLGLSTLNVQTIDQARNGLDRIDSAMNTLLSNRATLGAMQSKLQSGIRSLALNRENFEIARSRIADTDIAEESSALMRNNILQSAGISVLAQANMAPVKALKLLD